MCDVWQAASNSSALFLTAAAQNLLCLKLAEELGVIVSSPWVSWFNAASLPALVALLATPLVLYKLYPPETKDTWCTCHGLKETRAHGSCHKTCVGDGWYNASCSLFMGLWVCSMPYLMVLVQIIISNLYPHIMYCFFSGW
jgi:hypothetical protein